MNIFFMDQHVEEMTTLYFAFLKTRNTYLFFYFFLMLSVTKAFSFLHLLLDYRFEKLQEDAFTFAFLLKALNMIPA